MIFFWKPGGKGAAETGFSRPNGAPALARAKSADGLAAVAHPPSA
jgi:hypothetical protein